MSSSAASKIGVAALHEFAKLAGLNFLALVSVILITAFTVLLFEKYLKKKSPPEADDFEKFESFRAINPGWYVGLFAVEIYSFCDQLTASKTDFGFSDALAATAINVILNAIVFFICYGVLKVAGVNKENPYERCKKAFMGLVILSWALMALPDYTDVPTSQNVPAVNQQVQAEYVTTLNGENIFIDLNTLARTDNVNKDAAPEFKCVLIDTAEVRTNCEFTLRRGAIIMYIDGVEVGNSVDNPDVEELYTAIVKKFL